MVDRTTRRRKEGCFGRAGTPRPEAAAVPMPVHYRKSRAAGQGFSRPAPDAKFRTTE